MNVFEISHWIADNAVRAPQKVAIRFEGCETTYSMLEARIARLSGALRGSLGIRAGDRISFLGDNCPEIIELLFACARMGVIFVPLNARMTPEQLAVFLDSAQPSCLFTDTRYIDIANECLAGRSDIKMVAFGAPKPLNQKIYLLDDLLEAAEPLESTADVPLSLPILMAYTSGTTGLPKGALLSQDAIHYSALNSIRMFEMTDRDEILTVIPMYHIGGLSIQSVPALKAGATVTIHRKLDPALALRDIERYGITLIVGRPPVSRAISSHADWGSTDLSSLRSLGSGSARVPLDSMAPWFARGVPVQQLYGMTEALPPVIGVSIADARRKAGSIGKPADFVEARIVDRNMRTVQTGVRGEIVLRSKCIISEYWRNEEATRETFQDGWFLTGDVGTRTMTAISMSTIGSRIS